MADGTVESVSSSPEELNVSSYRVAGMTCLNCVRHVSEEISALDGVTGVDVDLESGIVRISGYTLPGDDAVEEAVQEAGYELIS